MKKTFLYPSHVSLGATMAPFGGFDMPIQYEGIIAEHFHTRESVTVFDTCHMGEFFVKGLKAAADLDGIVSCPVASMQIGQCRYGFICNEEGGVLDDQIVYRMSSGEFFMVVNAGTQDADFEWIKNHISPGTLLTNASLETGKIDLQGPSSPRIIEQLLAEPIWGLKYYRWMYNVYKGKRIIVSRTGYTGEIGFEIYLDERQTVQFWNDCLALGAKPAGLGARDTLRLEMGFPLYGHELEKSRNAAQSGFSRAISSDKTFIGSNLVLDPANAQELLCGIALDGRRTARSGDRIHAESGEPIGVVTSGSFSPCLERAIAMGYVAVPYSTVGRRVIVTAGRNQLRATVTATPFYQSATARRPISEFLT